MRMPVPSVGTARRHFLVLVALAIMLVSVPASQAAKPPPVLTSLSVPNAAPGSSIEILGSGFKGSRGASVVLFAGGAEAASYAYWKENRIVVEVPSGAVRGDVVVVVDGSVSNGLPFTPWDAPTLSAVTPNSALPGAQLALSGAGFGDVQSDSIVTVSGVTASVAYWSDTSVTVLVPDVPSGDVLVDRGGAISNPLPFTRVSIPALSSLSPSRAAPGTSITITGTDLGDAQGSGSVDFGTTSAQVVSWTDTEIVAVVPDVADCAVTVTQTGQISNPLPFERLYAPTIASVSPSSALEGSSVTVAGSGFEAVQGLGSVTIGGAPATVLSWSDTAIDIVASASGDVVVTQNALASNAAPLSVYRAPALSSISPTAARSGDPVTLTGADFGDTQGSGSVTFSGVEADVLSWGDAQIVVVAPDAASGPVVVHQNGGASNSIDFTRLYATQITHLSSSSGSIGSTIDVLGVDFGDTQGIGSVTFNGVPATIVGWSDTLISVVVPGSGPVVVSQYGLDSNAAAFSAFDKAVIDSLSTATGAYGDEVVITGSSFESTQGAGYVTFAGVDAEVVSWSDTSITVLVPVAPAGPVVVVQNGEPSNGVDFDPFMMPVVSSLSSPRGQVGSTVTINGAAFGSGGTVTLAGAALDVLVWSDTSIQVSIPDGAITGDIVVHAAQGDSNTAPFKVFVKPRVTSLTPVNAGDPLSDRENFIITGTDFESEQGIGWVTWAGVRCSIVSWSDTQIVATVPDGAPAGYIGVWQNGVCSNGVWRQFNPMIDTMSNWVAVVGSNLTLTGRDFGAVQTSRSRVSINGVACEIVSWSDTQIVFKVPAITQAGYIGVYRDGIGSNGKHLVPAPRLTSLSAKSLAPGQQLTIYGEAFGATQETGCIVKIGGVQVPVVSWSDTAVVVTVTEAAQTGYVGVYRQWASSNGLWFLPAYTPRISSLSTSTASPGQAVTITGESFYAQSSGSKVTLNGVACPIVSWSATEIVFTVPAGATTGYVGVWNYGLCSNGVRLTVPVP